MAFTADDYTCDFLLDDDGMLFFRVLPLSTVIFVIMTVAPNLAQFISIFFISVEEKRGLTFVCCHIGLLICDRKYLFIICLQS